MRGAHVSNGPDPFDHLDMGANAKQPSGPRVPSARDAAPGEPFLHEGSWWARTASGGLLHWDAAANIWSTAPTGAGLSGVPRARFASLRTPAIWVYVMFGIFIAATLLSFIGTGNQIAVVRAFQAGDAGLDEFQDADDLFAGLKGFQSIAFLLIPGFFIWWFRRAACNVRNFGVDPGRWGPGWAVGSWFIPFANIVLPAMVAVRTWKCSAPEVVSGASTWQRAAVSPLVLTWWIVYSVAGFLWSIAAQVRAEAPLGELEDSLWLTLAGDVLIILAAVLAILFVRALTARQAMAARTPEASGAPDGPRPEAADEMVTDGPVSRRRPIF